MKTALEQPLLTGLSPKEIFSKISNERGAVWLDSSFRIGDKGCFSFIARRPKFEIIADADNFNTVINDLSKIWQDKALFSIGFFSYEGAVRFSGVKPDCKETPTPLLHFFFYDSALKFDHFTGEVSTTNPNFDNYSELCDKSNFDEGHLNCSGEIKPTVSKSEYFEHVRNIKEHIKEGDVYQANYTCRFDVESNAHPFAVYRNLRKLNPAPYSAYLNFGHYQIISSSPERMFKRTGDFITSCPIKGTAPAGRNGIENEILRNKLLNSAKDKAELLMIVDLMRNDLGKIAETGSVEVSNLFTPEEYSSLIHLVADVSATIANDITYENIFKALLPGGSITGAPKKRAIEILRQQESTPRGVYTGSIGYVNGDNADFNIAIRTMVHRDGIYHVQAGGGIVADSDPESEYQEMQLKARNLFRALGTELN